MPIEVEVNPQMAPITGTVRGRGWSEQAHYDVRVTSDAIRFRCDDDARPELWLEIELNPFQLYAMLAQYVASVGPLPVLEVDALPLEIESPEPKATARDAGFTAYFDGLPLSANPYPTGIVAHSEWLAGYNDNGR